MATVHWTQPGLKALAEVDGHGDTCGPIVILDYRRLSGGVALDIPTLDAERAELIRWGLMTAGQGMTISSIATALTDHYGVTPVKVVHYTATLDFAAFHQDLIDATARRHECVIFETSKAFNLPGNQAGVDFHFLLVGGIDSTLGYSTCNGDTVAALTQGKAGHPVGDPVWYSIGAIQASEPCGYLILPTRDPILPPPPPKPNYSVQVAELAKAMTDLTTAMKANGELA